VAGLWPLAAVENGATSCGSEQVSVEAGGFMGSAGRVPREFEDVEAAAEVGRVGEGLELARKRRLRVALLF